MLNTTPTPARIYHEPVPAYMQRLTMMGARFIAGNTGQGAAGNAGDQGNDGGAGNETGEQGQQGQAQQQQNNQAQPPAPDASKPPAPEPSEQQGQQGLENATPEQLRQVITDLRAENARDRTTARDNAAQQARDEVVQSIGKALGIIEDGGDTPDADKLTQQLTEQTQTAKQAQLELAVYKAAANPDLGVDAAALLDSRSFLEKIAEIDPSKTDDLVAAIKDAVKTNPRLHTTGQAPGKRSSAPFNQGNQIPVAETPEELAKLIPRQF